MIGFEDSVKFAFLEAVATEARNRGVRFQHSALNGQDRHVFADHLIYSDSNFALIEFKSGRGGLYFERKKKFIGFFCDKLKNDDFFLQSNNDHHFMVWYKKRSGKFIINNYAICVCSGLIAFIKQIYPLLNFKKGPYDLFHFCIMLFSSRGFPLLNLVRFSHYLKLLVEITGKKHPNVLIFHSNPSKREGGILEFKSIEDAYYWFLTAEALELDRRYSSERPDPEGETR